MLVLRLLSLSFSGFCCCYALLFSRVLRYSLLFCVFFSFYLFFSRANTICSPGCVVTIFPMCVCFFVRHTIVGLLIQLSLCFTMIRSPDLQRCECFPMYMILMQRMLF